MLKLFIGRWGVLSACSILVLVLLPLILVSLPCKRNSWLYKLKVAVLGLIVAILAVGTEGCIDGEPETQCYSPVDPGVEEVSEDVDGDEATEAVEPDASDRRDEGAGGGDESVR